MAKRTKLKIDTRGPLQKLADAEAANDHAAPLVNEFAAKHGDYDRNLTKVVNRGGTPVDRWLAAKQLSSTQERAIGHCLTLWLKMRSPSRGLVANLDRTAFGTTQHSRDTADDAIDQMAEIKAGIPAQYWAIYESVCRDGEPAGVAGSTLANNKRSSIDAARTVVCFVADLIAMRYRL